jgi:hypothetical protein
MLKELIKVIQQEHYTYRDPITEFLECLYVNYDFEGAQQKLRECEEVSICPGHIFCHGLCRVMVMLSHVPRPVL